MFTLLLQYAEIVSQYRLQDRGSIRGRGKGFSLCRRVQTDSGTHNASYPMVPGAASLG
jgi:hypothetical protein